MRQITYIDAPTFVGHQVGTLFVFDVVIQHLIIKNVFTPSIKCACLPISTRVVIHQILDKPFV